MLRLKVEILMNLVAESLAELPSNWSLFEIFSWNKSLFLCVRRHLSTDSSGFVRVFWPTEQINKEKISKFLTIKRCASRKWRTFFVNFFSMSNTEIWIQFDDILTMESIWKHVMKFVDERKFDWKKKRFSSIFQDEQTALILAARRNQFDLAKILLEAKANVNANDVVSSMWKREKENVLIERVLSPQDNWTALLNASHNGNFDLVKLLIENGAQIEHFDCVKLKDNEEIFSFNDVFLGSIYGVDLGELSRFYIDR